MKMKRYSRNGVIVLKPQERRIDASNAVGFKESLSGHLGDGSPNIVINLDEVRFIDSSGLGVLVSALKEIGSNGEIKLCHLREGVRSIFELTRLDTVFDLHGSEGGAVESFKSKQGLTE